MLDLLVRGGTVVTAAHTFRADVAIRGEKIAAVGLLEDASAAKTIDVDGLVVLPGLIDPHIHLAHPFREGFSKDDFLTGTAAAAVGGNTSVIDFAIQRNPDPLESLAQRLDMAAGRSVIDYSFHACLTRGTPETIAAIPALVDRGLTSFKLYMTYRRQGRMADDGLLLAVLEKVGGLGGIVGVHAENDAIGEYREAMLLAEGKKEARWFPLSKPNLVESEAINRACFLNSHARGKLFIFHLSARESLDSLERARAGGNQVWAETCVHYLGLTSQVYERQDGHRFICSPPLRSEDDTAALWTALADGRLSMVSSDHCGFDRDQKDLGREDFSQTPNGLPGVETRLPVMWTLGVAQGRLTPNRLAALLSTGPARLFGLFPEKGDIAPGMDADLVIIDPRQRRRLTAATLSTPAGWSPFEGMDLCGWPVYTISRGEVVAERGRLLGKPGRGRFLKRRQPGSPC